MTQTRQKSLLVVILALVLALTLGFGIANISKRPFKVNAESASDYPTDSGTYSFSGITKPGAATRFAIVGSNVFLYRDSSFSFDGTKLLKTQSNSSGIIVYAKEALAITSFGMFNNKETNVDAATVSIYTITDSEYLAIAQGTENSTKVDLTKTPYLSDTTLVATTFKGAQSCSTNFELDAGSAYYIVVTQTKSDNYWQSITFSVSSFAYSYAGLDEGAEIAGGNGTAITLPAAPADNEAGQKFMGWKASAATKEYAADAVLGAGASVTLTQATTFTAQWGAPVTVTFAAANEYGTVSPASATVGSGATYVADGATMKVMNGYAVLATATAAANEPDTYSYNFTGWTSASGTLTENTTLTAGFERVALKYTVTFMNGEETFTTQEVTGGECAAAPTPAPEKTGYSFAGWYEEGAATAFDFATPVGGAFTLYAHFSINDYTLTWNAGAGELGDTEYTHGDVAYGAAITAPTVNAPDGYYFYGWNEEVAATMPAEATTYTAVYRAYAKSFWFASYLYKAGYANNYSNAKTVTITNEIKAEINDAGYFFAESTALESGNGDQYYGLKLAKTSGTLTFRLQQAATVTFAVGGNGNKSDSSKKGTITLNGVGYDFNASYETYSVELAAGEYTITVSSKQNAFINYMLISTSNDYFLPKQDADTAPAGNWTDGFNIYTQGTTVPVATNNKSTVFYTAYAGETLPAAPAAPFGYSATGKWTSDGTSALTAGTAIESGKVYKALYYSFNYGGTSVRLNNNMGIKYSALFSVYGGAMTAQKLLKYLGYSIDVTLTVKSTGKYKTYTYTNDSLTAGMAEGTATDYRVAYTLTGAAGSLANEDIDVVFTLKNGDATVTTANATVNAKTVAQTTYNGLSAEDKATYGATMQTNYGIEL